MPTPELANYGVVVIGRNEGDRLKQCLMSVPGSLLTVYVDSGSTDGSIKWARDYADVLVLDTSARLHGSPGPQCGICAAPKTGAPT